MTKLAVALKSLLELLGKSDMRLTEEQIDRLWQVDLTAATARRRRTWIWGAATAVAAACAVVFLVTTVNWNPEREPSNIELYALRQKPAAAAESKDVRLIMADASEMNIGSEESQIDYTTSGKIIVDRDTIENRTNDFTVRYNQVVVPHGKRTRLRLSDGTAIYVNSGTRVVYPLHFGTGNREIYVEGEAYLEVAHDKDRPFIVRTGNIDVKVLGTKFNVFAYEGEQPSVVLVDGSVDVSTATAHRRIRPGQKISANGEALTAAERVNVESYISWIRNELVYDNESLTSVFRRLQTYYGLKFDIGCDISRMHVSGRLSLAENPSDVLSAISFSVPVSFERSGDTVKVAAKKANGTDPA